MSILLDKEDYNDYESWEDKFKKNVDIKQIKYNKTWDKMFTMLFEDKKILSINEKLTICKHNMYPKPDLLFNAFNLTSFDKLKVVIIGQDPYFSTEKYNDDDVPLAMGLSFSVPKDFSIPSSLNNIFKNLAKYNHYNFNRKYGNLESWALQGCLLLNNSLTVLDGKDNANCHRGLWSWFTDRIIKYISDEKEHVVFVLWGAEAFEKHKLIDLDKHEIIVSSHPSGLSALKPMKNHLAFMDVDHFGLINTYLNGWELKSIIW